MAAGTAAALGTQVGVLSGITKALRGKSFESQQPQGFDSQESKSEIMRRGDYERQKMWAEADAKRRELQGESDKS